MWPITVDAYTSAVQHRDLPDSLLVRSRDRLSLENVCRDLEYDHEDRIFTDMPSDYPWRMVITRDEYKRYLCIKVDQIDYTNFKNAATDARPDPVQPKFKKGKGGKVSTYVASEYHDFLMQVWTASHMLTEASAKAANTRAWGRWSTPYSSSGWGDHGKGVKRLLSSSWGGHDEYDDDVEHAGLMEFADEHITLEQARLRLFGPLAVQGDERAELIDELEAQSIVDPEIDALLDEVDRRIERYGYTSVHDMTDEQWLQHQEDLNQGL